MCEHIGVSALTGKKEKGDNDSATNQHNLFCNHSSGFNFKVTLMESNLISRNHPPLNKNRHLLPSEFSDDWGTYFYHMIAVDWSDYSLLILHGYCFMKWMVFYW